MPRRKASRVPSRAIPTLPDESITEAEMHQDKRKEKMKLLLRDFDFEVETRIKKMEAEIQIIQENIHQLFKMDLMCYPETTRNKLWIDYIQQDDTKTSSTVKDSVIDIISSADCILQSVAKKRGRKPKKKEPEQSDSEDAALLPPPTVTKTTRSTRQRKVLASNQSENMPPPSTRPQRTKALEPQATPMKSDIPANFSSHLFITPKFDPRTPLPLGTIKRKPQLGEVAISLKGSPLQISPPHIIEENVEDWIEKLKVEEMDENMRLKLREFHQKVGDMLNA